MSDRPVKKHAKSHSLKRKLAGLLFMGMSGCVAFAAYSVIGGILLKRLEIPIPPFVELLISKIL